MSFEIRFLKNPKQVYAALLVLLLALLYFPFFGHLDAFPIRMWDEGRLANNALEMFYNGNYLVTHFNGQPDLWNTKPPLMIWSQVAFIHLLGPSELAIRLPSALAGLASCLLLFFFLKNRTSIYVAFLAAIILVTTDGFVHHHVCRTGDYDALLVFFQLLAGLSFYIFLKKGSSKWLYLFFGSLMLAVLCKGIAGLLFAPAYLILLLWKKQFFSLIKNKHLYLGILLFLFPILAYYLGREANAPGYLAAVYANELGGRFLEVNEGNAGAGLGTWFYFYYLLEHLNIWTGLVVMAILSFWKWEKRYRELGIFSIIMSLAYLLVITLSQTKLYWYDAPMFPFLAILAACLIGSIFDKINNKKGGTLLVAAVFALCGYAYFNIIQKTHPPKETAFDKEFYAITYLLRSAVEQERSLEDYQLLREGRNGHNLFYIKQLQHQGIDIKMGDHTQLKNGDKIIVAQTHLKNYINAYYEYDIIEGLGTISLIKIKNTKQNTSNKTK